jgi:hypothetical protein
MRLWLWVAVSAVFTLQQGPAPLSAQSAPPTSKTWIGRYAEFEDFLKTATVEKTVGTPVGILAPRHAIFAPGGLASGAAIKKIKPGRRDGYFESYKSEIAAYKLDRLLKLDMVPPTIEREWEREGASWQIWIDNTRMLKDIQAQKVKSPDAEGWNRQYHRVQVFDNLVGNIDENAGNLLFDPAWNFIKIDHSRAFTDTLGLPFPIGPGPRELKQIDRPFFNRLKALDRDVVKKEIGEWLTENNALPAVMKRRDDIVKKFEELAKKNGESAVFVSWPGEE